MLTEQILKHAAVNTAFLRHNQLTVVQILQRYLTELRQRMSCRSDQHQRLIPNDRPLQCGIGRAAVQHQSDVYLAVPDFGDQIRFLFGLQMNVQPGKGRPQLLQERRQIKRSQRVDRPYGQRTADLLGNGFF
ncbi:hypothetical protein D3C80_1637460 [compost metagenome]